MLQLKLRGKAHSFQKVIIEPWAETYDVSDGADHILTLKGKRTGELDLSLENDGQALIITVESYDDYDFH